MIIVKAFIMMQSFSPKLFVLLLASLLFVSCSPSTTENPYKLPDKYFLRFDDTIHDGILPLPVRRLENITHKPINECEREDLKQLFMVADWQLHAFYNQGYVLKAKSTGVQILFEAFPELEKQNIVGENGHVVFTNSINEKLQNIQTNCDRGSYP